MEPLFSGAGEVAQVMAGWDWPSTAVGAPESWPLPLRTMVRVLLTSRFSMWLGWGPELSFFYNDAYRRDTLGVKHPWALGRPASEVWAEIWPDIAPRVDAVMSHGTATWDEDLLLFLERSGYREETYHTFSYSPVPDADGQVGGLLCVVTEQTERVISDRRMATLRRLASGLAGVREEAQVLEVVRSNLAANGKDLPFALLYLSEPDGTARLACASGLPAGHPAAPAQIHPGGPAAAWGRVSAARGPVIVENLEERFGPMPDGALGRPPTTAALVPLSEHGQGEAAGFLVVGLNPFRRFQAGRPYDGFLQLLAGQIAAGIAAARAYEAERRRAEALAQLDRAKTEFFSNVSHEFRTPLTLIVGPAEDILDDDGGGLPPEQVARLEVIRRNARRLRRLVNDMLDFARIEGGRMQAETQPIDLAELTSDIVASFAPAIERAGLNLVVECPPISRPVLVDLEMWEKIVLNLVSNALKFTLQGTVRVSLAETAQGVRLEVSDTGVGVGPDQLPLLFQRFHRAPNRVARSHEGTGIGLALVYELVRLHGGSVAATSELGRGSIFTVDLPFGERASVAGPSQRDGSSRQAYLEEALLWGLRLPVQNAPSAIKRRDGATVLVVEDNADMRAYLVRLLTPHWDVLSAADGDSALRLARDQHPDLVLTDVMIPGLDGFGLLKALRSSQGTATVPVIFLSARAGEESAVEGLEAGADDYLVKPFSALELLARIRSNLELARLRNRAAASRAALIESLREGVAVLDAAGMVLEVNAAFSEMLGLSRQDLPCSPPYPWLPDSAADPSGFADEVALWESILADGHFNGIMRARHPNGRELTVEASVTSVDDDTERRFVLAVRDVTAEVQAAERETALARFGIRLAEATGEAEVEQVGRAELAELFGAASTQIVWEVERASDEGGRRPVAGPAARAPGSSPGEGLDPLDDASVEALATARSSGRVVMVMSGNADGPAEEALCVGMAAPLEPAARSGALWVGFLRSRRISAEDRALFGVLCGYLGQALRRAQLFDDSKAVATAMQRSILGPSDTPPTVAVCYAPAVQPLEVGGDWYDALELSNGRIGLVVGDCVGRGLHAATVMGQLRSACRAMLLQTASPAQVVSVLDTFAERIPGAMCTTVFCAVVSVQDDSIRYCSAGHLPAVMASFDGVAKLLSQSRSLPLGIFPGVARRESADRLSPGSVLVLYSDGLVERRGETLDIGIGRLVDAVGEGRALGTEALATHLTRSLLPQEDQRDDVALVVYRHPGNVGALKFSIVIDALPGQLAPLRSKLSQWLRQSGVPRHLSTEVLVACGEAASNAVEHAYGPTPPPGASVSVEASALPERVEVRVRDHGRWKAASAPGDRGRGTTIMKGLMDDVAVLSGEDGTEVVLVKELAVA